MCKHLELLSQSCCSLCVALFKIMWSAPLLMSPMINEHVIWENKPIVRPCKQVLQQGWVSNGQKLVHVLLLPVPWPWGLWFAECALDWMTKVCGFYKLFIVWHKLSQYLWAVCYLELQRSDRIVVKPHYITHENLILPHTVRVWIYSSIVLP